jgi:protein SCO1/2
MMKKRDFIKLSASATVGVAALVAAPVGAARISGLLTKKEDASTIRRRNRFPNVPLLTHEGKLVKFYDDLIKDKTVLINFMYVRCGEICPGMTANLRRVQEEFGDRMGKDVFMYSVSLDQDTPEMLKGYAELFNVEPGWTFLTGKNADIETLRNRLGFNSSDPKIDKDRTQHTGVVKFGIEHRETWAMAPALSEPQFIADYLRWMEPKGKRPVLEAMIG